MLIVRIPVITNELANKSFGFIITATDSYMYNKDEQKFEQLNDMFIGPYSVLDKGTDKLLKSFLKYSDKISDMEESLYADNVENNFLKKESVMYCIIN